MNALAFDLNDIEHEPSDEQLAALMESVAVEVRTRSAAAKAALRLKLHEEFVKHKRDNTPK